MIWDRSSAWTVPNRGEPLTAVRRGESTPGVSLASSTQNEWLSVEWRKPADQSDLGVVVTPSRLVEIHRRVEEIYEEVAGDGPDDDAERGSIVTYSIPRRAVRL